jgi:predicted TIM-barrel fold metal-dependent hydrolase
MIIDTHVHLVGLQEKNGCYVHPRMTRGVMFRFLRRVLGLGNVPWDGLDDAYRNHLVRLAEQSDLDGVAVLAMDGVYNDRGELDRDTTRVLVGNDYCVEVCRASPKLIPVCSVNPKRRDALDELDRVDRLGTAAIKLVPNSQGFDPAERRYEPFWKRMADRKIPLLCHASFEHTVPVIDQAFGRPERLRPALECGVTVIAAHCSTAGISHLHEDMGTWLEMIEEYPALYGDLSSMASVARFPYLRRVLEHDLARERCMLGSDFPVPVWPSLFLPWLGITQVRKLRAIPNPLQRNLESFRAMGVDTPILERAASVLRLNAQPAAA